MGQHHHPPQTHIHRRGKERRRNQQQNALNDEVIQIPDVLGAECTTEVANRLHEAADDEGNEEPGAEAEGLVDVERGGEEEEDDEDDGAGEGGW